MPPGLTHTADVTIQVGQPITVGVTQAGLRRVVPILGGLISGSRLKGTILPAGADYQLIQPDGYTTLDARYVARLDDGAMIYIVNTGVRFGPPEVMARIARGEPVDPARPNHPRHRLEHRNPQRERPPRRCLRMHGNLFPRGDPSLDPRDG
jgi:Protein of unknown function (DUF3237)